MFTSTDGNATITVGATITSSTQSAASCLEKDKTTYTATATCNGQTYTTTKTVDGAAGPHSYTKETVADNYLKSAATCTAAAVYYKSCEYCGTSSDSDDATFTYGSALGHTLRYAVKEGTTNVCEETCTDCDHYATATLTAADKYYEPGMSGAHGTVTCSDNWIGEVDEDYTYAVDKVGAATAKVTLIFLSSSSQLPVTLTCNYQVLPLDIANSYAEYWPHEYRGDALIPVVYYRTNAASIDGIKLTEDTDYTIAWDKTDLTQAGEYTLTVTGINNYTGSFTQKITIAPANLKNVSVVNNKAAFDYTGEAQKLDVTASGETVNGSEITFTYRVGETGEYVAEPAVTDGGTHTVYWKASAPNHNDVTGSFTVTVNPGNGNASVSVADLEYGDAVTPIPVSSTNDTDHVTYQYKVKGADDSTYTSEAPKLPGEYTVKATFAATDNYNATTATADFEITKRKVTATVMAQNKTYDGTTDAAITAIVVGVYDDTFEISGLTGAFSDATAGVDKTVTIDSSNATVTGTNVDYYEISFPATTTATISKAAAPTITFPTVLNAITYGQKLEEAKLSFYTNNYGTFNWNAPTAYPGKAGTGSYALDFYPNELALQNYDWQDTGEAQWIADRNALCICPNVTVNKAPSTLTAPTANDLTYDGTEQTLIAAGSANGGTMVYSLEKEGTYTAEPPKAIDAGTYTVWYKVVGDSNHNDIEADFVSVEIKKANASVDNVPAAISGLVYNGREQYLITSTYSMGGTVYYSLDGVNYTESLPKGINAQEYTVYYKVVGDANHNDMEPKTVTAKIAPWNIETASCKAGVWGGPFTYNGQEHTPVPQIDAWVDDYPVPGNPYAPGADVRLTEGTDYTVTYSNNVNAGEAVVTFTGKGNYTGTITRKFTIAPKPITVTIANKTSVYGKAIAELTATDNGIVNNDTNVYSLTTTATSTANVGTYPITGTALDANYDITFVNGTYTITKAQVNSIGTDMALSYSAGMEVDLRQMFSIDENAGEVNYWITHLTGDGSFTSAPYLYRIDKAGTFTVKITTKETTNYKSGEATAVLTVNPGDPGIGAVTAGVVNDMLETAAIVLTRENTDIPGTLTVDAEQTLAWGDNTIRYTFTPNDTTNYKVVKGEVTVTVVDNIAPTGTVTLATNNWTNFLNNITFGLFFKETQTVSVVASDNLAGVAKIEYIESKTALDLDAVKAATRWTEMKNGSVSVTLEDTKQFVYYIRITDKSGNVSYLSSDGAEYDTSAPVIAGVNNGVTYYTSQTVTVTDKNIDTITLNGEAATGSITLEGNKEATYTIVATDKAGNSATVIVKMAPIADITESMEGMTSENVTSDDKAVLQTIVDSVTELLKDEELPTEEKEALEKVKADAEALLKVIEDADKAADTENTDKVENVTTNNVTPDDKADLEKAKADLEKALEDNGGNYTAEEKKAIEDELKRIEDALEIIRNVEAAEDAISDLPATVEPDDEKTVAKIEEAKKAYEELTDYEKSLVDEKVKEKLDQLTASAVAYDIIKGDGSKWSKDTTSALSFTANGSFSKFVCVEIDGKVIDAKHYTAQAGSTVITLNASYLETLSVGEHTITVVYTNGEAEGTFKVNPMAVTPATGDDFNILLWISVMIASLAAISVLLIKQKKRRYAK